jgi:hypothetical protein
MGTDVNLDPNNWEGTINGQTSVHCDIPSQSGYETGTEDGGTWGSMRSLWIRGSTFLRVSPTPDCQSQSHSPLPLVAHTNSACLDPGNLGRRCHLHEYLGTSALGRKEPTRGGGQWWPLMGLARELWATTTTITIGQAANSTTHGPISRHLDRTLDWANKYLGTCLLLTSIALPTRMIGSETCFQFSLLLSPSSCHLSVQGGLRQPFTADIAGTENYHKSFEARPVQPRPCSTLLTHPAPNTTSWRLAHDEHTHSRSSNHPPGRSRLRETSGTPVRSYSNHTVTEPRLIQSQSSPRFINARLFARLCPACQRDSFFPGSPSVQHPSLSCGLPD